MIMMIVNDDRCHVNKGVIANNHLLYSIVKLSNQGTISCCGYSSLFSHAFIQIA